MELITAYIYNTAPIQMTHIKGNRTTENLKMHNWFEDARNPSGFKIMLKRFFIDEEWYRVVVRFKTDGDDYELDAPVPFMVFLTEKKEVMGGMHEISIRFADKKAWHGKKVGSTVGFMQQGVPAKLINAVVDDLKECVAYTSSIEPFKMASMIQNDLEAVVDDIIRTTR